MLPRLDFKQMSLGSIHNFPNLGTIIITEGDGGTCQLPEPYSSFALGTHTDAISLFW